jgi:hypothetical protein
VGACVGVDVGVGLIVGFNVGIEEGDEVGKVFVFCCWFASSKAKATKIVRNTKAAISPMMTFIYIFIYSLLISADYSVFKSSV